MKKILKEGTIINSMRNKEIDFNIAKVILESALELKHKNYKKRLNNFYKTILSNHGIINEDINENDIEVKAIKLLTSLYEKDDNKVEKIFIINKEKYEKMKNENYILVQTILNINLNNKITQIAIIYDLKCILFNITPALQLSRLRGNYVYDKKTNKIKIYIL